MEIRPFAEPFRQFQDWYGAAEKAERADPNAMALATVGPDGMPAVRMVLLKSADETGFVFYTNLESRKGCDLLARPKAALCLHWKSLKRQVRVEGMVERVGDAEADAYFHSRPRASQIGAWASQQSRPLKSRFDLEKRVAEFTAKYMIGEIPRPAYWSGFRVVPQRVEFWEDRPFRLHDRLVYHRTPEGWAVEKLYP